MRLRREVGDFNFEVKNGAATINKNLFPEQLIGQIVVDGSDLTAIVTVTGTSGDATYSLKAANNKTYTYTVATGAVSVVTESTPEG